MKKRFSVRVSAHFALLLTLLFFLITQQVFADAYLTKGACEGELYLHGIYEGEGNYVLYRSADHGQTVTMQDSIYSTGSITAGVDLGEIYVRGPGNYLYYSSDYGISFTQKALVTSDCDAIASGNALGEIYIFRGNTIRHSSDYGASFLIKDTLDIMVGDMCVGLDPGEIYIGDGLGDIYHSIDYGESFDSTGYIPGNIDYITRGAASGEIYVCNSAYGAALLYYSSDHGDSLSPVYAFTKPDTVDSWYIQGIAGASNPGEIYVFEEIPYFGGGGEIYINYSTDYGDSFIRYHPFSTTEDVLLPQAIDDLICVRSNSSIFLDWPTVTKDIWNNPETVDYYVVYRDTLSRFSPVPEDSIGISINSEYLDLFALENPNTKFFYIVKAVDDSGNKSKSSNVAGMVERQLMNY